MSYDTRTVIAVAQVDTTAWDPSDGSEREWESGVLEKLEYPEDMTDFLANTEEAFHATKEEPRVSNLKGELWRIDGELIDLVFALVSKKSIGQGLINHPSQAIRPIEDEIMKHKISDDLVDLSQLFQKEIFVFEESGENK